MQPTFENHSLDYILLRDEDASFLEALRSNREAWCGDTKNLAYAWRFVVIWKPSFMHSFNRVPNVLGAIWFKKMCQYSADQPPCLQEAHSLTEIDSDHSHTHRSMRLSLEHTNAVKKILWGSGPEVNWSWGVPWPWWLQKVCLRRSAFELRSEGQKGGRLARILEKNFRQMEQQGQRPRDA